MVPYWAPRRQPISAAHLEPNSRPATLFLGQDVGNPFGAHKAAHFVPIWGLKGHVGWDIKDKKFQIFHRFLKINAAEVFNRTKTKIRRIKIKI